MNILHPDTGDIIDRVTILHLKLERAEEAHWREELKECYQKLEGWNLPVRLLETILWLMAVNARIWQLGDELETAQEVYGGRELPPAELQTAQEEYAKAWNLNKRRARIVSELNSSLGQGAKREKV